MKPTRLTLPILFIASAALFAVLALVVDGVEGRTITVDDDGGADYEKIQDAINASQDGDTVRVYEGHYEEHVVVDKSIDFIGNGSETTTIDGGGSGDVVQITADWVNMSGFSVTGSGNEWSDAGIKVESSNNHIFMNNCSDNKHGIKLSSSSYCTISNNTCLKNERGIRLYFSSTCTLTNNTCENNGQGIRLQYSAGCTITNNTCSWNNDEGIKLSFSSYCKITNNTCENNEYGISLGSSRDCTTTNNNCSNNEYGISLGLSRDCTLDNNNCSSNDEYGIWLWDSDFCTLTNNTISKNRDGMNLEFSSQDNTAHYNNIYNSTEYGINASDNNNHAINATYNWWGSEKGPYHPTVNPDGTGDNVTDYVEFGPWLKESAVSDNGKPEENETDKFQHLCLSSLLLILVSLLVLLVIVIHLPGKHLAKNKKDSIADENPDESSPLPDSINTCPYCGGKFEVESTKRPIRFNCNFCGEKVEFK